MSDNSDMRDAHHQACRADKIIDDRKIEADWKSVEKDLRGPHVKQVIVIRRDLGMRRGKEIAQGSHASMKWLADRIKMLPSWIDDNAPGWRQFDFRLNVEEEKWLLGGSFTKICLQVDTEAELLTIYKAAQEAKLTVSLIEDSGRTEFGGIPTKTCIAIGPNISDDIDKITKHLKLY